MARRKSHLKAFGVVAKTEAEGAAAEAAIRAVRAAKSRLKAAHDPESSLKAYREVFSDFDALARDAIEDGARDLRQKLQELFPNAIHVTDFFHVTEHLAAALWALYPRASDDSQRESLWSWLRELLRRRNDGAESVCRILEQRAQQRDVGGQKWAKGDFAANLAYLKAQRPFMRYAQARRARLHIGSGVVEAACKTLVTQRLKVSGAQWTRPGARAVLHLRALSQSNRLNAALIHHAARHPARLAA